MTDAREAIATALRGSTAPCVTSSFQTDCVALIHMIRRLAPDIPILFLDTVHHFPETLEYRDRLIREWALNVVTLRAVDPQPGLWRTNVDACCAGHKVEPLFRALDRHDLWLTALRREQSASRANLKTVETFRLPSGRTLTKVNPLAAWSAADVEAYAREHDIPVLSLYARGYTSIGCAPCTTPPLEGAGARSGRWRGQKLECGIHLQPVDPSASG